MGLALGRSRKVRCGPQNRTPAAPLAFPSRPMPPDEPSCPWTAAPQLSCCCMLRTSETVIHVSSLSVWSLVCKPSSICLRCCGAFFVFSQWSQIVKKIQLFCFFLLIKFIVYCHSSFCREENLHKTRKRGFADKTR